MNAFEGQKKQIVNHDEDIKRLMKHINKFENEFIIPQGLEIIEENIFN